MLPAALAGWTVLTVPMGMVVGRAIARAAAADERYESNPAASSAVTSLSA